MMLIFGVTTLDEDDDELLDEEIFTGVVVPDDTRVGDLDAGEDLLELE